MEFDFDLKNDTFINEIARISDADFGMDVKKHSEQPKIRFGARGIVLDENGNIAVLFKENKNEYKLIGGGIDDGESPKDAFMRECEEEIGYKVQITNELGTIIEDKTKDNFKQLSFVFEAKITTKSKQNLTQKETDEGAKILWLPKLEALEHISNSLNNLKASKYDSVYRSQFMVLRDKKILEFYLNRH